MPPDLHYKQYCKKFFTLKENELRWKHKKKANKRDDVWVKQQCRGIYNHTMYNNCSTKKDKQKNGT